jgi:diguanylate cyclase (GGDEF)-like protein
MNRSQAQQLPASRPASRRLHRHPLVSPFRPRFAFNRELPSLAIPLVASHREFVRDAGMLELIAAQVRIAELEELLAGARELASTDYLTGALNRRGLERAYARERDRSRRNGQEMILVHLDLDDFKQLNDGLGHQAGDKALVFLVRLLQNSIRSSDILCRNGGEEFVLILSDITLSDAKLAVSRFLHYFSSQTVPGTDRSMTFSAGIVVHHQDETLEEGIRRADEATYVAKQAGKNCIVCR